MADEQEHRRLYARLDEVMVVAREAAADAKGAHYQSRRTNGRVDRLEETLWGDPTSLDNRQAGVVGIVRSLKRDIRIGLAVLTVLMVPTALVVLGAWLRPVLETTFGG